jgi:hypothetical protein
MASTKAPEILSYLADAAVAKGSVVKGGTDSQHVAKSTAGTDKSFGIAQNASAAAEDVLEVAVMGGAKGLAGGAIAVGDLLTADSAGKLVATTSANDRVVGVALDSAVSGDLFEVLIQLSNV